MKSVGGFANRTGVNTGYKTLSTIQDDRLALRLTVLNALAIRNDSVQKQYPRRILAEMACKISYTLWLVLCLPRLHDTRNFLPLRGPTWVFVVVFISSVIHITFVFSSCRFLLVEIITDTVWFKVALQLADILVADVNSSYYVILQLVNRYLMNCEPQITTVTWKQKKKFKLSVMPVNVLLIYVKSVFKARGWKEISSPFY